MRDGSFEKLTKDEFLIFGQKGLGCGPICKLRGHALGVFCTWKSEIQGLKCRSVWINGHRSFPGRCAANCDKILSSSLVNRIYLFAHLDLQNEFQWWLSLLPPFFYGLPRR